MTVRRPAKPRDRVHDDEVFLCFVVVILDFFVWFTS